MTDQNDLEHTSSQVSASPTEGAASTPSLGEGLPLYARLVETSGQTRLAGQWIAAHTDVFRHSAHLGWFVWDGTRWCPDPDGKAAHASLTRIMQTSWSLAFNDADERKRLQGLLSHGAQAGALKIAANLDPISISYTEFDSDPTKLNCANGILDLSSLTLTPHEPGEHLTKITNANYDEHADQSTWLQFLATVLPDKAVREYLQRFIGLSLLGEVREHILGIATGVGANGKSTFVNAILHALGDYATAADSALFLSTKESANAASPALMQLRGVRFVVCSETEEDQALAPALTKQITGGDRINARQLYKEQITFEPSHTALMVTNHLPKIHRDDPALFRRLKVIPFDVTVPESEQDPLLGHALRDSADGILAWAVEGLRTYLATGMATPAAVEARTAAYRSDSDSLTGFLATELSVAPNAWVSRADILSAYETYCRESGAHKATESELYKRIEATGTALPSRRGNRRGFKNVQLTAEVTALESIE